MTNIMKSKFFLATMLLIILHQAHCLDSCYIKDVAFGETSDQSLEFVDQKSMCPDVTSSCCSKKNYQNMLTWWRDDGTLSMSQVWNSKIRSIHKVFNLQEKLVERVVNYAEEIAKNESSNVNCRDTAEDIIMLAKSGAVHQAHISFDVEARKCWDYTIDFLRGIACGVCQSDFEAYLTKEYFNIDKQECITYASECKFYWKAYYTLYNYIGRFHRLAVCKNHEIAQQIEYDNFFDERYLTNVNQCMKDDDNFNQYCRDLCTTEMPVLGITRREVISFPQVRNWLRYVENTFVGEDERRNYEDEVVNGWLTNKDKGL